MLSRLLILAAPVRLPPPRNQRVLFHLSAIVCKDKPSNMTKGEPKKSRFIKVDEQGNEIKEPKKDKTAEDKAKLEAARKEREIKKKETRLKQIEIQKKREAGKKAA